jgi:hypothetical protein
VKVLFKFYDVFNLRDLKPYQSFSFSKEYEDVAVAFHQYRMDRTIEEYEHGIF